MMKAGKTSATSLKKERTKIFVLPGKKTTNLVRKGVYVTTQTG
jgi:exosome complex RNA-binding protein Csl4